MAEESLPSRGRGLKCYQADAEISECTVAPFTGAWIEIILLVGLLLSLTVAPFTGAWIEI